MEKKFELTDEKKVSKVYDYESFSEPAEYNHTLYRIKALRDFGDVKAGQLGGWVEKESNLSHEGNCFVYDDAEVWNDAKVTENAIVKGNSKVSGSMVYGLSLIHI